MNEGVGEGGNTRGRGESACVRECVKTRYTKWHTSYMYTLHLVEVTLFLYIRKPPHVSPLRTHPGREEIVGRVQGMRQRKNLCGE